MKEESLQKFNFQLIECIQAVTNHEPKGITDPLKLYMCAQKLFNLEISAKTIRNAHPIHKAMAHAQKIKREFLPVEGIQQMEFDKVMSIDAAAGNDPMTQERLADIMF